MKLFGKHEENYMLKNTADAIFHLTGDYTLVVYEKRVEVIRSRTQKRDMKMLDGSLRRADTFLISWDEESFSKANFGRVK
jgi:hypothetical protein